MGEKRVCTPEPSAGALSFSNHEINHLSRLWESELVTEKTPYINKSITHCVLLLSWRSRLSKSWPCFSQNECHCIQGLGEPLFLAIAGCHLCMGTGGGCRKSRGRHSSLAWCPSQILSVVSLNRLLLKMDNESDMQWPHENIWQKSWETRDSSAS